MKFNLKVRRFWKTSAASLGLRRQPPEGIDTQSWVKALVAGREGKPCNA